MYTGVLQFFDRHMDALPFYEIFEAKVTLDVIGETGLDARRRL